ncbi:MAG: hypothetical protein JW855_00820 [Gammaproteobacteria bacterium]|nr:hypothetical protein [Gammaproteobacteria bacterium]
MYQENIITEQIKQLLDSFEIKLFDLEKKYSTAITFSCLKEFMNRYSKFRRPQSIENKIKFCVRWGTNLRPLITTFLTDQEVKKFDALLLKVKSSQNKQDLKEFKLFLAEKQKELKQRKELHRGSEETFNELYRLMGIMRNGILDESENNQKTRLIGQFNELKELIEKLPANGENPIPSEIKQLFQSINREIFTQGDLNNRSELELPEERKYFSEENKQKLHDVIQTLLEKDQLQAEVPLSLEEIASKLASCVHDGQETKFCALLIHGILSYGSACCISILFKCLTWFLFQIKSGGEVAEIGLKKSTKILKIIPILLTFIQQEKINRSEDSEEYWLFASIEKTCVFHYRKLRQGRLTLEETARFIMQKALADSLLCGDLQPYYGQLSNQNPSSEHNDKSQDPLIASDLNITDITILPQNTFNQTQSIEISRNNIILLDMVENILGFLCSELDIVYSDGKHRLFDYNDQERWPRLFPNGQTQRVDEIITARPGLFIDYVLLHIMEKLFEKSELYRHLLTRVKNKSQIRSFLEQLPQEFPDKNFDEIFKEFCRDFVTIFDEVMKEQIGFERKLEQPKPVNDPVTFILEDPTGELITKIFYNDSDLEQYQKNGYKIVEEPRSNKLLGRLIRYINDIADKIDHTYTPNKVVDNQPLTNPRVTDNPQLLFNSQPITNPSTEDPYSLYMLAQSLKAYLEEKTLWMGAQNLPGFQLDLNKISKDIKKFESLLKNRDSIPINQVQDILHKLDLIPGIVELIGNQEYRNMHESNLHSINELKNETVQTRPHHSIQTHPSENTTFDFSNLYNSEQMYQDSRGNLISLINKSTNTGSIPTNTVKDLLNNSLVFIEIIANYKNKLINPNLYAVHTWILDILGGQNRHWSELNTLIKELDIPHLSEQLGMLKAQTSPIRRNSEEGQNFEKRRMDFETEEIKNLIELVTKCLKIFCCDRTGSVFSFQVKERYPIVVLNGGVYFTTCQFDLNKEDNYKNLALKSIIDRLNQGSALYKKFLETVSHESGIEQFVRMQFLSQGKESLILFLKKLSEAFDAEGKCPVSGDVLANPIINCWGTTMEDTHQNRSMRQCPKTRKPFRDVYKNTKLESLIAILKNPEMKPYLTPYLKRKFYCNVNHEINNTENGNYQQWWRQQESLPKDLEELNSSDTPQLYHLQMAQKQQLQQEVQSKIDFINKQNDKMIQVVESIATVEEKIRQINELLQKRNKMIQKIIPPLIEKLNNQQVKTPTDEELINALTELQNESSHPDAVATWLYQNRTMAYKM